MREWEWAAKGKGRTDLHASFLVVTMARWVRKENRPRIIRKTRRDGNYGKEERGKSQTVRLTIPQLVGRKRRTNISFQKWDLRRGGRCGRKRTLNEETPFWEPCFTEGRSADEGKKSLQARTRYRVTTARKGCHVRPVNEPLIETSTKERGLPS